MSEYIEKLAEFIKNSENIVFFGGAGVSTESGVPDFRSKDGLYNNRGVKFEKYRPEYLLSHSCLQNEPEVFFEFYRQKMDARSAAPNAAHTFLAKLEQNGKLKTIITQNIDGLHQKAGGKNVIEIHGSTERNYCMKCKKNYPPNFIFESKGSLPRCDCGGIVRCDVTLYEEQLPNNAVERAVSAIKDADMLIIGGTSLTVYPAAYYVRYFGGKYVAIINKEHIPYDVDKVRSVEINEPIGAVFAAVAPLIGL